jgi:hypothetical protein
MFESDYKPWKRKDSFVADTLENYVEKQSAKI